LPEWWETQYVSTPACFTRNTPKSATPAIQPKKYLERGMAIAVEIVFIRKKKMARAIFYNKLV
jgi:hypothetical protein